MTGKIVKGIGGFYYVHVPGNGTYACRARGLFRRLGIKPLVGDDVRIDITSETDREGSIREVLPRKSVLFRPAAANVDQALLVFAAKDPEPNTGLIDRMLIQMQKQDVDVILCLNKIELVTEEEVQKIADIYRGSGCRMASISVAEGRGLETLKSMLAGKTTIIAGVSGVGKSSLANALYPEAKMETGEISEKIRRGKNTTRHTELFALSNGCYFMDTPGFSSLYVDEMRPEELKDYYPEFSAYEGLCRFNGCNHMSEPDCAVKDAVRAGKINRTRYEGYRALFKELQENKRY